MVELISRPEVQEGLRQAREIFERSPRRRSSRSQSSTPSVELISRPEVQEGLEQARQIAERAERRRSLQEAQQNIWERNIQREREQALAEGRSARTAQQLTQDRQAQIALSEARMQAQRIEETGRVPTRPVIRREGESVSDARVRARTETLQRVADTQSQRISVETGTPTSVTVEGVIPETSVVTPTDTSRNRIFQNLFLGFSGSQRSESNDFFFSTGGPVDKPADTRFFTPGVERLSSLRQGFSTRAEQREVERILDPSITTTIRTRARDVGGGLASSFLGLVETGSRILRSTETPRSIGRTAFDVLITPGFFGTTTAIESLSTPGFITESASQARRGLEDVGENIGRQLRRGELPVFQASQLAGDVITGTLATRAAIGIGTNIASLGSRTASSTGSSIQTVPIRGETSPSTLFEVRGVEGALAFGARSPVGGRGVIFPVSGERLLLTRPQIDDLVKRQRPVTRAEGFVREGQRVDVSRGPGVVRSGFDFTPSTNVLRRDVDSFIRTSDVPSVPIISDIGRADVPSAFFGQVRFSPVTPTPIGFTPTTFGVRASFDQAFLGGPQGLLSGRGTQLALPPGARPILESPFNQLLRSTTFTIRRARPATTGDVSGLRGRVFTVKRVLGEDPSVPSTGTATSSGGLAQVLVQRQVGEGVSSSASAVESVSESISESAGAVSSFAESVSLSRSESVFGESLSDSLRSSVFARSRFSDLSSSSVSRSVTATSSSNQFNRALGGFVSPNTTTTSLIGSRATSGLVTTPRSITGTDSVTRTGSVTTPQTTTSLTPSTTGQSFFDIPRTPRTTRTPTRTRPPRRVRGFPRLGDEESLRDEEDSFLLEIRRGGEFTPVSSLGSKEAAINLGLQKVGTTLAASFRVRDSKGGVVDLKGVEGISGGRFRTAVKDSTIAVERRSFRLGTGSEVTEIQGFRQRRRR